MSGCSCDGGPIPTVSQRRTCVGCNTSNDYKTTQKKIWKQVRVYSSLFTMSKSSANVNPPSNLPLEQYNNVNWNQSSDRNRPSVQHTVVPTRGNSTKYSITRERPGSCSPGGKGLDVKHNSYDRYLNRRKSNLVRNQCDTNATPLYGNKKQTFGLLSQSGDCCKC